YRRWNALHGGVYVPVTETTPPNPLLDVEERDLVTPSGRRLTMVNPAYMTRQVHALGAELTGAQGHLTSLRPVREANAADPWERASLLAFEAGAEEVHSIEMFRGESHMRLMRPLITERACLRCHEQHGYAEGDLRGGLSVAIPMSPLWAISRPAMVRNVIAHVVLWLLGLAGIVFFKVRLRGLVRQRERVECMARDRTRYYRSLLNGMHDDVLVVTPEREVVDVNHDRLTALDAGADEAIGATCDQLLGCFDGSYVAGAEPCSMAEVLRTGRPREFRRTRPNRDGSVTTISLLLSPLHDADGGISHVIWAMREISDIVATEQRLESSEARFESLVRAAPAGIGVIAADRLAEVNDRMCDLTARSRDDLLGSEFADLFVSAEEATRASGELAVQLETLGTATVETTWTRAGGPGVAVLLSTSWLDAGDHDRGMTFTAFDVTMRKALEGELLHARKLEAIGQLAAGIAHEINTPMQFIGDNTRFLRDAFAELEPLLDPTAGAATDVDYLKGEIPRALEQSLEGIGRVATIVQAMKEFSHPSGVEKQVVDLNHAIASTITVTRNEWKYAAELETDFDDALPAVRCHPSDLNQVVLNLVVNAAHAVADAVGEGSVGRGRIKVSTRRDGDDVEIAVADTGVGIPAADRERIFDPFFTTKEVGRGTGQGLNIVHNIVTKKHGGTIAVESEVGVGTTIRIRLPLDEVAVAAAPA
ncbi:MAG: DUF3365 domain-containing protein, partial [Planctomycetes bacterium]|nr:DUF3365 domain-containing protein [Planctomycetota bacterium]